MSGARHAARAALGALVALVLLLVPAAPAQAHASYVGSDPANGQTLAHAPSVVRVTLSEPVTFVAGDDDAIAAYDAAGRRVDTGAPSLSEDRHELRIPLQPDLPDGAYLVNWVIVSADSHPAGGSIQFGVNVPATFVEPDAPRADPLVQLLAGLAKALVYLALVVGLGVPAAARVLAVTGPAAQRLRRWALWGLAAAAIASALQVGVQFLWVQSSLGAGVFGAGAGTGTPVPWDQLPVFLASAFAVAAWVRLGVLAAAAAVVVLAGRAVLTPRAEAIGLVAAVVAASATVAAAGHGGAGPTWRLVAATAHGAGAIAWLGGLAVLALLWLRRRLDAIDVRRLGVWSAYAGVAVALVVASGVVQAFAQVRYPAALWTTTYGIVLLAKLALVAVALGLGAGALVWGRRERARADGAAPGRTARLRRRVRAELATGIVIVALSGILSTLTPAGDDYTPVARAHTAIGPYDVDVTIVGARTGAQRVIVHATPDDAGTRPPARAEVTLSAPSAGIAALPADVVFRLTDAVPFTQRTAVRFETTAVTVPVAGRWQALVTLVVDDWRQYSGTVSYDVEP